MDIILYNIFTPIICLLIGYLFGAFPTAIIVGKVFFHQDITKLGSHNPGGTNAGRLWGKKVGFSIILFDMCKTIGPMWILWAILTFVPMHDGMPLIASSTAYYTSDISDYAIKYPVYWLAAAGCMLGNCFSIFAHFKGGKGVSVFMGLIVGSSWLFGFIPGLIYFLILKLKKMVSLAGIVTSVISCSLSWIWTILLLTKVIPGELHFIPMYGDTLACGWVYSIILTFLSLILIIRHKGNIKRMKEGTERKISWMK